MLRSYLILRKQIIKKGKFGFGPALETGNINLTGFLPSVPSRGREMATYQPWNTYAGPPHHLSLPWAWNANLDQIYGHGHDHCYQQEMQPKSNVEMDSHKFLVRVDVQHFSPDELTVHFADGNQLIIEGKHDERSDEHGHIERHFKRRYDVPPDVTEDEMICSLSTDGILTVHVPRASSLPTGSAEDSSGGGEIKKTLTIVQTRLPARGGGGAHQCERCYFNCPGI